MAHPRARPTSGVVVAVDLGGTRVKSAVRSSREVARRGGVSVSATRRERGHDTVVHEIVADIERICASVRRDHGAPPLAIGVAVPGIVDVATGTAVYSANLGWRDLPIGPLVRDRTGVPVAVVNDVHAGALAEARLGAGARFASFVFLPIGTGIGGAIVHDGAVLRGAHAHAGELGHVVIAPEGPPCACGGRGCLETYASAPAIARAYQDLGGGPGIDAAGVAGRAAKGDPIARAAWQRAVEALARAVVTMSAVVDPQAVILGGGVARAGDLLLTPMRAALRRNATFHRVPELLVTDMPDDAACHGAAVVAAETHA